MPEPSSCEYIICDEQGDLLTEEGGHTRQF